MRIATVTTKCCHPNCLENVSFPGAKKGPHLFALLVELYTAAPLWLCLTDSARKNPRINPIEKDGLEHTTDWMHTGYVDNTAQMEIQNKTSSRDHITSTLPRTADRVNCAHSWYTKSSAQTQHFNKGELSAIIPSFGSTASVLPTMMFSKKGNSLSLTTKGDLIIFSRFRFTSAGLKAFPS